MKSRLLLVAILVLTVARPSQAQEGEGIFIFGGGDGYVHNLGSVLQSWRVTVTTVAALDQPGPLLTCPIQVTVLIMPRNSLGKIHRKTAKRNALVSTFDLASARFAGDAVLIIQAQNVAHRCFGTVEASVTTPDTIQDLDRQTMTSDDGTVENWAGDIVPEQAIPVGDEAVTENVRRLLLSIRSR